MRLFRQSLGLVHARSLADNVGHSPLDPQWGTIGQALIALRFADVEAELAAMKTLAICDVSALAKLGIKGSGSAAWLQEKGIDVPPGTYESRRLSDGGFVVRVSSDEYFLESGTAVTSMHALEPLLDVSHRDVYRVQRQDATILLSGSRALEVMRQTCGVDLNVAPPRRLLLTRIAGVNAGIMLDPIDELPVYRIWVDFTFALFLWQTLDRICAELGGRIIGAACFYPDLMD